MIEHDRRRATGQRAWPREVGGNRLDPVEVEVPGLEDVAVALLLAAFLAADGPLPIGKVAQQRVELAAPILGPLLGGSGHRLRLQRR